ncbi:cell division ATP-binding protein FtsE [Corynebacterium nuruki]|uniref:cell division ATP-binding protein FtsE n=1 Tax=Corynebacterium nuruki TaxID=1032851 RepID=UPI0023AC3564|nr:cell division ATP-binding protein FtsE [Wolbachia endosymbiont of Drosophila chauvacae]MDN6439867.1 cell division ATP-binding protein FtsE [Corynebacterium nuruki]
MITFEKVSKTYRNAGRPALKDISVDIDKGEFVFLIGPSGSGKSTFLQLIMAEERPDSGTVTVGDQEVNSLKSRQIPPYRQRIGYVFQDFRLLPKKSVSDNVAFALEVIGKDRAAIAKAVPEALDLVGLSGKEHRLPDELSGGEQQRVAIARAVVNRPLVLLADEPTGNLDPDTSAEIMALLARINRGGTTVVMSTHDNVAVDSMRRRVLELSNGKLVRDDAHGVYGVGR